jgi:hypothetical protein
MIRHENDLMNHRLTWLMTAEGLLFTALGFALSNAGGMGKQLIPVLSFVGVLLAASAAIVLDAADTAIRDLSGPPSTETLPGADVIGYRGLEFGIGLFAPWRIYPPMFIVAWYLISQM